MAEQNAGHSLRVLETTKTGFGLRTWTNLEGFADMFPGRARGRIVGMSFPKQHFGLGLEPSILTVLPDGDNVFFDLRNRLYNDNDVQYYLCSVYISGFKEFVAWALQHDKEKIVVGGYHPTTFPEEFERYAGKIVQGPCDDFWATLAQPGKIVTGVTSHQRLPRRDLYDIRLNQQIIPDKRPEDVVVSMNTSIGCNQTPPCDFCCSPMMCNRILSKPLELVEREVASLVAYAPKFMFLRDENFTMQPDWKERLAVIHRHLPETRLYLFASANTLNDERIAYLAAHGVYMVCLGLEDPTATYQKNRRLDEVMKLLKTHRVMAYLSFIVNPRNIIGRGAGEAFYNCLNERIRELAPEMICGNFLMPFRGTKIWDDYYADVSPEDYVDYDSKTPFLVRNPVVRQKMQFFMFWNQWTYYTSDFYRDNVRTFETGDTLHQRFQELYNEFRPMYERLWDVRA